MDEPQVEITTQIVPGNEEKIEVTLIDFRKSVHEPLVEFSCGNYLEANRSRECKYVKGLKVYGCECGDHAFAAPWDDAMSAWANYQRMPPFLRQTVDAKGAAPKRPPPSPHVVICDPGDAHLLKLRRWRAWPTRPRCRAKWELKAGPHGLPLQRMIMAGAKVVRFRDGNGLNVRRENLLTMTKQELAEEWRAKKAAAKRAREAAKAAA